MNAAEAALRELRKWEKSQRVDHSKHVTAEGDSCGELMTWKSREARDVAVILNRAGVPETDASGYSDACSLDNHDECKWCACSHHLEPDDDETGPREDCEACDAALSTCSGDEPCCDECTHTANWPSLKTDDSRQTFVERRKSHAPQDTDGTPDYEVSE